MTERLVRYGGLTVALLATLVTAVLEVILAPLRLGGVLVGVAIPIAIVANYAIAWFAESTTARRWAFAGPWALWTVLTFFAAGVRTREGDQLIWGDNWVALVMIFAGSLTFATYAYRMLLRPPPAPAALDLGQLSPHIGDN